MYKTFPLRLPSTLRQAIDKRVKKDGLSVNQFLVAAAVEKISTLSMAEGVSEASVYKKLGVEDVLNFKQKPEKKKSIPLKNFTDQ